MGMADKVVLYSYLCFFRGFGEVGAAKPDVVRLSEGASAAFRRLCVETFLSVFCLKPDASAAFRRLCVETFFIIGNGKIDVSAAFRRLCVETTTARACTSSPPSAAFRRLCVETNTALSCSPKNLTMSAAFRRLCVETNRAFLPLNCVSQPPSGGCVLKPRLHRPP